MFGGGGRRWSGFAVAAVAIALCVVVPEIAAPAGAAASQPMVTISTAHHAHRAKHHAKRHPKHHAKHHHKRHVKRHVRHHAPARTAATVALAARRAQAAQARAAHKTAKPRRAHAKKKTKLTARRHTRHARRAVRHVAVVHHVARKRHAKSTKVTTQLISSNHLRPLTLVGLGLCALAPFALIGLGLIGSDYLRRRRVHIPT